MKQAVLTGPQKFELREAELPLLGLGDVRVRIHTCGVCASELHAWQDGEGVPLTLGHEVAGEVIAIGEGAGPFRVGDRVTGLFHHGFAEEAVASADRVAAVPNGISMEHAFGEPLACAVSAAQRTKVELGDRIAIVGLGFMGLLMLQLVRLKGPAELVAIDIRDDALAAARRLGADMVVTPAALDPDWKVTLPIRQSRRGFDVIVEATGTQAGLTLAAELVREHGVLSILGYHQGGPRQVDMKLWNYKALEVLNAHERRVGYRMECMKRGLALAGAGELDLASLVTHRFPLDRVGDAFGALAAKPPGFIKSIVTVGGA
jgi:threonine dehydrogenase-like Zn-dependent dehydrogenase